jgi:UDPglucose--hexose-1-phosphate uridylyltransferase
VRTIKEKHPELAQDNVLDILKEEIGIVFATILEHAGVFKRDEKGQRAFERFIHQIANK